MAQYIVKVIAHALKNNKVAKFNEKVDESQLTSNALELVAQGFIELYEGNDSEDEKVDEESESEAKEEAEEKESAPELSKKDEVKKSFQKK